MHGTGVAPGSLVQNFSRTWLGFWSNEQKFGQDPVGWRKREIAEGVFSTNTCLFISNEDLALAFMGLLSHTSRSERAFGWKMSWVPPLYLPAEPLSSLSLSQLMWLLLKSFVAKLCLWPCGCLSLTHTLFKYMHLCGVCISVCISMFLYVCVYELCFCVYLYFVCACIYGYLYECPYLSIRYVFLWVFICECV